MREKTTQPTRRDVFGAAAAAALATQLGALLPLQARAATPPPVAPPPSRRTTFGEPRTIVAGVLEVSYAELGPKDGPAVVLLHGWPYDIHCYEDVAPKLADAGYRVIVPFLRGYGGTRFLSAQTPRNAQQTAFAADTIALMDALGIGRAIVAGCDWGARTACVLAALWPERCNGLVSVSGYLVADPRAGGQPLAPEAELAWWYQFYFATERGRAGYEKNRAAFARLIWQQASPAWRIDDATFQRSAVALDNPDHVAITIHNYRWRMGLAAGEARFDAHEARLAAASGVHVPSITLEGDANGAPHADPSAYARRFMGPYEHRNLRGGIGHNLPQEAPDAFADAVVAVARMR